MPDESTTTTPPPKADEAEKMTKAIEGLLAKHGDPNAALRVLLNENYGYRDKLRDLTGKVPADGAVILQGDDAKLWNSYRDLGTPADIRKGLGERDTYKADSATLRKAQTHAEAAELHGYRPAVLKTLARDLDIEIVPDPKDAAVKVAMVKGQDDKGQPTSRPLVDYAKAEWPEFLTSLEGSNVEPPRPKGTPPPFRTGPPPPPPGGKEADAVYEETLRIGNYQRM